MVPFRIQLLNKFLRLFFYLLYHQLAWSYDWVASVVSIGKWQEWVLAVIPYLTGPQVLELGYGPGHLQIALYKKGVRSFGLDESRQMGRQAYKRLHHQGFIPVLINGYAQNLPFVNNTFHQIAAIFPTEFIADLNTLSEIYRVLLPGGEAIVLLTAWIKGKSPSERLASWLFHFTGQAPEWTDHFLEPILKSGFQTRVEQLTIQSNVLLVIRAQKPINPISRGTNVGKLM